MVCYGIKPSTIIPQNAGNRISEDLNFKISKIFQMDAITKGIFVFDLTFTLNRV